MKIGKAIVFTGGLWSVLLVCSAWGFMVHRTVNQLAVYELPGDLQRFFFRNLETMVKDAPRPDLRRNTDSTEATKHFIDLEIYGDSAAWRMSHSWEQAVATYSKDTLLKYGYLPYLIMKVKDSLTDAFRLKNKERILFYAADLGHYIGDANVPLHTTMNYDGQLTGQKGIHSLWETMIPELQINDYKLSSKHTATYLSQPEEKIWEALQYSFELVPEMLTQEKEVSRNFNDSTKFRTQLRRGREVKSYSTEFAKAYSDKLGYSINQQLIRSADLIADFIFTAWTDAGSPSLPGFENGFTKQERKQLKKEVKSFRKNHLVRDSLLLSRRAAIIAE